MNTDRMEALVDEVILCAVKKRYKADLKVSREVFDSYVLSDEFD